MPHDAAPELTMLDQVDRLRKFERIPVEQLDMMDWYLCLDLRSISSRQEFEKAVSAHKLCESYVGPLNDRYLRALHQMRLTLDLYMKSFQQWRLAAKSMQSAWNKITHMIKRDFPKDVQAKIQPILDSVDKDLKAAQ